MKKLIAYAFVLLFVTPSFAQKISEDKVPANVRNSFTLVYPNIKGTWEMEKKNFEVSFKKNGKDMSLLIDVNGTILETETTISTAQIPQSARDYIKSNYSKATIEEAARIEKANGDIVYKVEVNDQDLFFDKNGKFIGADDEDDDEDR